MTATAVLLAIGAASWLLLSYGLPLLLAGQQPSRPSAREPYGPSGREPSRTVLASANGTWFLWPVAAQSVAVGLTSLAPPLPDGMIALAVACWAVGVILYLLIAALAVAVLLARFPSPAELTPAYWVFMGATAISALAGAQILRVRADPLQAAVHAAVAGSSVMLWAFGTWLIPMLVILGIYRHVLRRVPLVYEAAWWSIAFPVGMYGVASDELGTALKMPWLVSLGRNEAWAALSVWILVCLAMIVALLRRWLRPATSVAGSPRRRWPP